MLACLAIALACEHGERTNRKRDPPERTDVVKPIDPRSAASVSRIAPGCHEWSETTT